MFSRPGRKLLTAIAFLLLSVVVYAGNNPEYRQTLFGKNGQLLANAQLYTFDGNFLSYPGSVEKTWYVKNAVRLMIDEESTWFISSDFIASIKLNIVTENAAGVITNHPQKTLAINYKTAEGQISGAISSYEFRDAVKVTVTIAEAITKNVSWDVTKNLKLVNEIVAMRDWSFSCSTVLTGITTDSLFADEWKVKWNVPNNFQTEYDLEWAWIDESAVADYTFNNVVNLDSVFESNATRVTTTNNFYRIPLLYEDNGRIYVRVRMAQERVNGQRTEGNWYYLSDGGLAYLLRNSGLGHQDNMNWQATTTFAEEGKRKTVIQYFDGTLRGRQTVTKDNVNGTTVVAESFYDYQGRPVLQVLPSPTLNTIIQFTKNFNQFDDSRNAKTVYDKLDVNQSSCNKQTAKMLSTATGSAAQYYSANNPQVNDGFNKYIPDAGGFPYAETRYTSDGTGRIDAQGGVGQVYQVNVGKDTRYYYESADQDDLDALFGTDAGYASHYSKNWVRDANGQYSVSYVDMRGRTVATALAGNKPDNFQALPSYAVATKSVTRQLIDGETNNVQGNSIVSSKSLIVPKEDSYQFNYYLSPEKLRMMLCTGDSVCFDCQYELNISIIPDCADKVIPGFTNPIIKKNFNLGQYLTTCGAGNSPLLDTIFNVILPEGSYTIVKELKMNTAARDFYRDNVFMTADTCKKKIDFITQQYQLAISQQNCNVTCTECNTRLGSFQTFTDSFRVASGLSVGEVTALLPQITAAYNEAKANCDRICDNNTGETLDELNSIRDIMLQDMTPPMGQYARYDGENPGLISRPYNIFNPVPLVSYCPPVQALLTHSYRYPLDYNASTGIVVCNNTGYKSEYGNVTLPSSRLLQEGFTKDSLTDNFEGSYAYNLLPYHPEFCKLQFAEANLKGTYRFGGKLQNTDTWSQAVSRGFINLSTSNANTAADFFMQKDSFFIRTGFTHPLYYQMRDAITSNYIAANTQCGSPAMGIWQLAKFSVFCHKEIKDNSGQQTTNGCFMAISVPLSNCLSQQNNLPPSSLNHCEADMNMVWKNFKALYSSYRNILIGKYLNENCSSTDYSIFEANSGNNYQERFTRYSDNPPYTIANMGDINGLFGSNGDPATYTNVAASEADSICRANSGNWMSRLRRCPQVEALALTQSPQWVADSAWLSKYLVDVCKQGVDYMGHPFGAASLPDGKPSIQLLTNPDGTSISGVYVRNFPDIVRFYLLHRFGTGSINQFCYPELVDYPKAYNVAPVAVIIPVITVPEPCACERINYFKTNWQNAGSPGTFSNYLLNTQGTSISQDTLNMLLQMCTTGYTSTNPNCNFLSGPIKLPAIFQCRGTANIDSSKTCITCADYTAIKQDFLTERGVAAPYLSPQTETEFAWNRAFSDYANYKTGFNKLWPEYIQFGITCAGDTTLSCTNLNSLLGAWQATSPPQNADSCRNSFTQYMNYHTGRNMTFSQWMGEFIKACGTQPTVCQPVLTCGRLGSLINSYYNYYGYQIWRNSNCQTLFTQFVNDSLYTSYTYQEIVDNYNYLCGTSCPLNICSFPNSHLLTKLYNHFKIQVYQTAWTLTQCQDNFTSWFNIQLGFTANPYTWSGIVSLYQSFSSSCVPDITQLCSPPYSCAQLNYIKQQFYVLYPNADSLGNCQPLFTQFFNQQMGTNYTFAEIQSIYNTVCLTTLPVCTGGAYWDCCNLILFYQQAIEASNSGLACPQNFTFCQCFVAQFNSNYNKNYDYEQIRQLYLDHCGFEIMICGAEPPVFTCQLLETTLSAFVKQYPAGGGCNNCQQFFASYFNNRHGTLYTYAEINNLYLVQCGQSLQVCNSQCPDYIAFVNNFNTRYGGMKIPLLARRQLFESLFNTAFGYNSSVGLNQPLIYSQIKTLMTGCLTMPANLENENLNLTLNDANTLRDFKTAYYLRHPNGTPVDCQNDFTAWVNWSMGLSKTWCELMALYDSILGLGSGDICGKEAAGQCNSGGDGDKGVPAGGGVSPPPVIYPPMLCGLNVVIFDTPPVDTSNCKDPLLFAITDATIKWELYIDSLRRNFDLAWYNKCINAKNLESFTVTYERAEYHYTLYYYDQAGQLVRTVPPEGVEDKRSDGAFLASVKTARTTNAVTPVIPAHTLGTEYRYNTLGQVVQQKSPDGGLSKFWYDKLGRLVVSQNAQQAIAGTPYYSYTVYDELGRIQEVGQKPQDAAMQPVTSRNPTDLGNWINHASYPKEQITRTVYDLSYFSGDDLLTPEKLVQRNLRNRVSYTQVFDGQPSTFVGSHRAATYYTYDIHGNVDTLLQDYGNSSFYSNVMNTNGSRYKKIAYNYDLISGKVNMVSYQPGYLNPLNGEWVKNTDRFYHRYSYDAENKLTDVYTSHDSLLWERDATYSYYRHGPLARAVLGQQLVQGTDYAYNLQGWLKGVNSTVVTNSPTASGQGIFDIGEDGKIGSSNALVARDAYGFSLNYYSATVNSVTVNDYKSINNSVSPFAVNVFDLVNTDVNTVAKPLFNGNIASMMVNIPKLGDAQLYGYAYDQLNRIMSMDAFGGFNNTNNTWTNGTPTASANYKERVTYDANGNIKTYLRNGTTTGGTPQAMDNLTYGYNLSGGKLVNNKLRHVKDAIGDGNYTEDVDNQPDDNYDYDAIGNLIKDTKEGITNITWSVYGKILTVVKNTGTITYTYDASGNRLSKSYNGKTTWYARDASGNVMGVYEKRSDLNDNHLTQSEVHLYGSSRLGVFNINRDLESPASGEITIFERGRKFLELSNHLGNVLVTITDRKIQVQDPNNTTQNWYYTADVVTAGDYYPFGMMMVGRKYEPASGYRYGFNGKENDKDISEGVQDYGMRISDNRLGRFLSVDPISKKYPELTPYQFASNRSIDGIDLDGLEYMKSTSLYGIYEFKLVSSDYTMQSLWIRNEAVHKIAMNHPQNANMPQSEDDSKPEVNVVDKQKDTRKGRWAQRQAVKSANRGMRGDIASGIADFIKWGVETHYDIKYKKEMSYARESIHALNNADNLVRAAIKSSGISGEKLSIIQTELVNYLTDGTIGSILDGNGTAVLKLGDIIFKNRENILNGKYSLSPEVTVIKNISSGNGNTGRNYTVDYKEGNPDPELKEALKTLEKVKAKETSVKASN